VAHIAPRQPAADVRGAALLSIPRRSGIALFFTMMLLGFLVATQARVQEGRGRELEKQSLDELTTLVGTLARENERLQSELSRIEILVLDTKYAGQSDADLLSEQRLNLGALRLATGALPAHGPGVRIVIKDEQGQIDAYDLGQLLNELKSAGAEALVVNGRRLTYRSALRQVNSGIFLDASLLERPYIIEAVGLPQDLESSLVMAGGMVPSLQGRPGVAVQLGRIDRIEVPVRSAPSLVFARPAPED
jgi:uncharacterized protein YlxW (UPF0749 family)